MEKIAKIDIHAHVTAYPDLVPPHIKTGCPFLGEEEQLAVYDRLDIEKGVLLPIVAPEAQWAILPNEPTKMIADAHPDRFLWFCNVDPRMGNNRDSTDFSYLLEHYKRLGAKGMGELTSNLYADDPKMDRLYSCLEDLEMPLTIHIAPGFDGYYGIVDDLGLPRLEKMLKAHPRLKWIGHSQCFWSEISSDNDEAVRHRMPKGKVSPGRLVDFMRTYENLYCDLSANSGKNAMMRDPAFAASFLEEFSDRILYGCDACATINTFMYEFDEFLTSLRESGAIRESTYRKIVRENAIRLLKLDEA